MTEALQKKPNYGVIIVLLLGAFIAMLNETLLNVALPSIMNDFGASASTVQWLSTGYMLVNGILIPITAFLIQKFSVRHLFLSAIALFTIGTFVAGFAPTFGILLAARMVQAAGSAIMMPLLMNVLLTSFPVEKRGGAMGFFGLVMIFAPAVGPTLSGWILQHYTWEMLFHLVSPIAFILLIASFFMLKDKKASVKIHLDYLSVVLSSIGFGGVLYGFSSAGNKGWNVPEVYVTIVIGMVALLFFIVRQFNLKHPMLEFRIFRYPMFALSSAISIVLAMAMFSAMLLLPIYVQTIRGIGTLESGLLMLPGALLMGIMSPITGKLFDKFGGRVLAIIGLGITILTTYAFSHLTMETSYTTLMTLYTIRMFGMSMFMMPVMTNGINALPQNLNPHATAMNNTLQQVAGAIGSAFLVTLMQNRTESYAQELTEEAMQNVGLTAAQGMEAMQQQIMNTAMVEGINDTFLISTFIAVVALVLAFFIQRPPRPEEDIPKSAEEAI